MPVAAANGIEINYTDSGGEGPAVVFSHGYLMDHTMFGRQVTALAPEYRVITWDQRGHGGTRATGAFTYWDSAADVLALLDYLGIERAVLAGMSQGGFLSPRAALTVPDQVRALVLIDSQAGQEDPANAPGYEQMHQAWLEHGPGPVQEVVASIILGPGQWEGWYAKWNEQYAQWAPDDLGQLTWPFRCLMDRDDMTGRLAEITCPTLIVHGTADAAIPPARAEAARDGLGGRVTAEDRVFHPASCRRDIEPLAVPVESVRAQVRAPVTADPSHDDITPLSQERLDLLHRCHPCTLSEPLA